MPSVRKGLSSFTIKLIAIAAMLIDHIAWAFVPSGTPAAIAMHIVGRLTAPVMCYFIAEGYYRTRNVYRYMFRLGITAVVSQIPFLMSEILTKPPVISGINGTILNPELFTPSFNVFYTLTLGLIALHIWKCEKNVILKILVIIGICYISIPGDWMCFSVLWILFFGIYRENRVGQLISYYCIAASTAITILVTNHSRGILLINNLWLIGLLFPPILFFSYNGERGNSTKFGKWLFYVFYPLHLFVIGVIKLYF